MAAVGEYDGGRAVPGLQHGGVVFVKRAAARVHGAVVFPGLGDHHHHGLADGVTRHRQEFQAVVKSRGVGLTGEADGVELLQVSGQHRRRHHAFARLHPVVVALDGVDLAVVRHITVGMGQRPLGEGIGRKTLVHQAQRRYAALVQQVVEVGSHLIGQQQAFVNHGAAGHAGHVILFAVLEVEVLNRRAGGFADHIQLALQRVLHDHIVTAPDKHLAYHRFFGAHRGRHGHFGVDRHIAPAQKHLAFGAYGPLHLLLAGHARGLLFGQKNHAHAVFSGRRQRDARSRHFGAVKRVGQLNQDTGAIAHQLIRAHSPPVVQVFENLQGTAHNAVAALPPNMGHKTDTASVMLIRPAVQTIRLQVLNFGCGCHSATPENSIRGIEDTLIPPPHGEN